MLIFIESLILCLFFTIMVYIMSRNPIKTLYNYPPNIQKRVKSLKKYKNKIPTQKNKVIAKVFASILFLIILCLILKNLNGCDTFAKCFKQGFLLWTIVNLYDLIVLDIIWFCHDRHFVFKGTEDMIDDYHDYGFHIKGFFIGEVLAIIICILAGLIVQYIM